MKDNTKLTVSGRPHQRPAHPVNTPVERASTYLFPTYDDYLEGAKSITYGRLGTSTHRALEEAVTAPMAEAMQRVAEETAEIAKIEGEPPSQRLGVTTRHHPFTCHEERILPAF